MNQIDRKLLSLVQKDGRRPHAELAAEVELSVSAVNERLKKLLAQGVIVGYGAQVSPKAVGLDVCAFVHVLVEQPSQEAVFLTTMKALPEVQECHHVSGEYSYLLKVRVRDTGHLESVIKDHLKAMPGVVRTNSIIVLSTAKETWAIDCTGEDA